MIDAIRQKTHRKNTQNDNLWVCFLNFYPLKKAMRNLPPSILVSRNGFSSLHPVKFSNCKHASYPKVHTWHHSLRNRVVVPFQVDLPPASEIDKSWKLWIVSFKIKMNSFSIFLHISYGFVVHLEGNWIWDGIDFAKSCSANKKTAHGVTTLRSCWDCHVGSSHQASTLPPIEITSLKKKK